MPVPLENAVALGRIGGPLLAENLVRKNTGVGEQNLAFHNVSDTDNILFLNVIDGKVGINNGNPQEALDVTGIIHSDDYLATTSASIAKFSVSTNRIINPFAGTNGKIILSPNQTLDPTILGPRFETVNLGIDDALIENLTLDSHINLNATGTGQVYFTTSELLVNGDLTVTGKATWDGSLVTLGSSSDDNIIFNADINSHIIPEVDDTYDLGSALQEWRTTYVYNSYIDITTAPSITVTTLISNGSTDLNGTVTIGSNSDDQIIITSQIDSDLIPTDSTYSLGTLSGPYRWNTAFLSNLNVDNIIEIDNNTITTLTDTDLKFVADGTGIVNVTTTDVEITNDLEVNQLTTLTNLNITGLLDLTGDWTHIGNSTRNGVTLVAGFDVITGFWGQSGIVLTGAGGKTITVNVSNVGVVTVVSIDAGAAPGYYISTGGTTWVFVQTGNTDITGSLTVNGANTVQFEDIKFVSNRITTTVPNSNLVLVANGTGIVKTTVTDVEITNDLNVDLTGDINTVNATTVSANAYDIDSIYITDNTITTNVLNTSLVLSADGTGKIHVTTTDVEITNDLEVNQLTTLTNTSITGLLDLTGDYLWTHTGTNQRIGNTDITGSLTVNGANTVQFDDIEFVGNVVRTTLGTDLELTANGTGIVKTLTSDVEITNDLDVLGTGYFNNLTVGTDIATNEFTVGDFFITSNDIITTVGSNIDIILSANGTGKVYAPTNDVSITNDLTVVGDMTVSTSVVQTAYTGLSWTITSPYAWIFISDLNAAAATWVQSLQPGDVFSIVNFNNTTVTVTVDYVDGPGTVGSFADIHVVENIGFGSYPSVNNPTITVSRIVPGNTSLKNVEIGVVGTPKTLTQIGNIDQTGNTDVTGNFQAGNIVILPTSWAESAQIKLQGSTISVKPTNTDLIFLANGIGGVIFDRQIKIRSNKISNIFDINDLSLSFNNILTTEDGELLLLEDESDFLLADTKIDGDLSIIFSPNGTGNVIVDATTALAIAYGTAVLELNGEIRQNTDGIYEGFSNTGNVSFTGLYDADHNTYINAELNPGDNDNTIRLYINGSLQSYIDTTKLYSNNLHVDSVRVFDNQIVNLNNANDLKFVTTGTGVTSINGLEVSNNSITNSTNDALILQSTGTGYIKFTGSNGIVLPSGDDTERRGLPELGETRYNNDRGYVEVFEGTSWVALNGGSNAATEEEIVAETNLWAFILG